MWCGVGSKKSRAATGKFVFEWNSLHASCYSLFVAAIDLNRSVFSLFCHLAVWVGSKNNGRACQRCDLSITGICLKMGEPENTLPDIAHT